MAIRCPGCGREYDVTLFQFGRTIHCTCGTRVGLEQRIGPPLSTTTPRFMADAMLGRLARWLRTLGYDTAYDDAIADAELVRTALAESRHILTRDRSIPEEWRVGGCLVLEADRPLEQLREVIRAFGLERPSRLFTRCRVCNSALVPAEEADVRDHVPAGVAGAGAGLRSVPGVPEGLLGGQPHPAYASRPGRALPVPVGLNARQSHQARDEVSRRTSPAAIITPVAGSRYVTVGAPDLRFQRPHHPTS